MNIRFVTFLIISVFAICLSACSKAESSQDEVVINNSSGGSKDEVVITNADIKKEEQTVVTTTTTGGGLGKRVLADKSYIETIVDGFGNKIETRYFPDNSPVTMLILRSSTTGIRQVTVYGKKGDTKIVSELGDNALTATATEIASAANLSEETKFTNQPNFMKGQQNQTPPSTPLQPLPSSAFQQPAQPVNQPPAAQSVSSAETTTTTQPPVNPEEDED